MPNWMLDCPECKKDFVHSKVMFAAGHQHPWDREPKPEFADGGVRLECPNCKAVSLYQRHQLTYSTK